MFIDYFLVILMVIIGFAPIVWELKCKKFDFFNLKNPFILYFVIQLGASGLITFSTKQASEIGLDPGRFNERYLQALLLSCLALLLFHLGYYTRHQRPLRLPKMLQKQWSKSGHSTLAFIYAFLGFISLALLLAANGGVAQFLADREAFRAGGMIGQGIFIFPATTMISTGALVYFLGSIRKYPRRSILLPIFFLVLCIVPAYLLGFRSAIALPVLQFLVIWRYAYRPIPSVKLAFLLFTIVVGFTLYGFSREIPAGVSVDVKLVADLLVEKPELVYTVFARSKGTEVVASVINTLAQTGDYELGWKSIIEAATILIPKAIWEGKPLASSQRFTTYFFGEKLAFSRGYDLEIWGGISPTVVGELYWHFGVVGVLSGIFFMGRIACAIYVTLKNNLSNPSIILIYAVFFTTFAMFAEAIQGYFNILVMYVPLLFLTFSYLNIRAHSKYHVLK